MPDLLTRLDETHSLTQDEYQELIETYSPELAARAAAMADERRKEVYGNNIFIRGLIEISSYCKNDCLYCGLRHSNQTAERYRLSQEQILECCNEGYTMGFRTFVLQGGEDPYFTDERLETLIQSIKHVHPDCAITLSLGERSQQSYQALFDAGADRYLLRHETADEAHYNTLHPTDMSLANRIECLCNLKRIGYQVGCGFMIGSPGQTSSTLAADLSFIQDFKPAMVGVGPFIPHHATPFANKQAGTAELTYYLISIIRLINPALNIPATTALATLDSQGRKNGIKAGANVVMPNLSPQDVRAKYELYNNKLASGLEAAGALSALKRHMREIGYQVVVDRGDAR